MNNLKNVNDHIRIGDALGVLCRKTCHPGAFCPDTYCKEMWDAFEGVERFKAEPNRQTMVWRKMHHDLGYECPGCGWESNATYNFCPNCGTNMDNFRPNCGADMRGEKNETD